MFEELLIGERQRERETEEKRKRKEEREVMRCCLCVN